MTIINQENQDISNEHILTALVYEIWKGKPVYYHGYNQVLAGKLTVAEVRLRSDIHGVLISLLSIYLGNSLNRHKLLFSIGSGYYLPKRSRFSSDLAIFDKEKVGKLKGKYFDVSPKVVIEIDIKADVSDFESKSDGYLIQKSQKLIEFGVEKVIWVITAAQKVYVIDRNDPTWYVVNWSENITLLDDCVLNIKQLLQDEEIDY